MIRRSTNHVQLTRLERTAEERAVDVASRLDCLSEREVHRMLAKEWIRLTFRVGSEAGPEVVAGGGHQACADRIHFYVAAALEEVSLRIDQRRSIAALPQSACATMTVVEVPHVPASERLHHASRRPCFPRADEQVRVIRHEHVCVDRATRTLADIQKYGEKAQAVPVVDEAPDAVVSPLEHVKYVTREHCTRRTWHAAESAVRCARLRHRTTARRTDFQGV